jgi:hypothetical protein
MGNDNSKNNHCNFCCFNNTKLLYEPEEKIRYNSSSEEDILKSLIKKHIIGSRNTIQEKCNNCNGNILLIWNSCMPQFLHSGSEPCISENILESASYKLAIKYTKQYLRRGGKLIFNTECSKCKAFYKVNVTESYTKIKQETKYGEDTFDITGHDFTGELIFAIQIDASDKKSIYTPSLDLPIFKMLAIDPIFKLDQIKDTPILIQNYQGGAICSDCMLETRQVGESSYLKYKKLLSLEQFRII